MEKKKYGLFVAISMIVGIVVGSGVFFKGTAILLKTGGNVNDALIAWIIGGLAMVFGALTIANYSSRISKANGLVDYFEEVAGKKAGYLVGWFTSTIYYPGLAAVVAWVAGMFTSNLLGLDNIETRNSTLIMGAVYLFAIIMLNIFSRYAASRFQVSATVIKLIPLTLLGVVGLVYGLTNGGSLATPSPDQLEGIKDLGKGGFSGIAQATVATAFAYDGWICAVAINDELKEPKKILPKALAIGTFMVLILYIIYFLGITYVAGPVAVMNGQEGTYLAAQKLFGVYASKALIVFIIISCLGTVNGLCLGGTRVTYQLALRNQSVMPNKMKLIEPKTGSPVNSSIFCLVCAFILYAIWILGLTGKIKFIEVDALPIVLMYITYATLYVFNMIKFKDLGFVKRFVYPTFALLGALIVISGGFLNPDVMIYLIISIVIVLLGLLFYRKDSIDLENK